MDFLGIFQEIPGNPRIREIPARAFQGIPGNFQRISGSSGKFQTNSWGCWRNSVEFPDNSRIQKIPGKCQGISGEFQRFSWKIPGDSLGIREFPGIREPGNSPDPGISRECPGTFRGIPWHSNGILGNFQGIYQGPGSGNSQGTSRGIPWHFQGIPREF